MTGKLTTKHYIYAMIYVDHATRAGIMWLQVKETVAVTIEVDIVSEIWSRDMGVTFQAYPTENLILRPKKGSYNAKRNNKK